MKTAQKHDVAAQPAPLDELARARSRRAAATCRSPAVVEEIEHLSLAELLRFALTTYTGGDRRR